MAFCSNCGKELLDSAKYCSGCGTTVNVALKQEHEQRKTVYDGDLHRCPNCGEHLNAFETICPVCKYELRGIHATSCVHELSQKLENSDSMEQKIELISNFYIPNTKEDIFEFFILAYSNITANGYGIEAWVIKLEQAYLKAKFSFGNSEEFIHIKELYESIKKVSKKKKIISTKSQKGAILMIIGALLAIVSLLASEILREFRIYMYDALYPIAILGFVSFAVGLILFVIPDKK